MTRGEILDVSGMDDNATFVKAMKELEQCDFIRKFTVIGKKAKGVYERERKWRRAFLDK